MDLNEDTTGKIFTEKIKIIRQLLGFHFQDFGLSQIKINILIPTSEAEKIFTHQIKNKKHAFHLLDLQEDLKTKIKNVKPSALLPNRKMSWLQL